MNQSGRCHKAQIGKIIALAQNRFMRESNSGNRNPRQPISSVSGPPRTNIFAQMINISMGEATKLGSLRPIFAATIQSAGANRMDRASQTADIRPRNNRARRACNPGVP